MTTLIIIIFVLGYLAIAFEHPLQLNKTASALFAGIICWTLYFLSSSDVHLATEQLNHHLSEISSIVFFLLGAMTIVELIDTHNGFSLITDKIKTKSLVKLMFVIATLTFFLSSILDNLTTAIVMISLCAKILKEHKDRLWFAGIIIIAANAGGAWTPIGDVTTTMLWIGGQITMVNIMVNTFIPSLMVALIPTLFFAYKFRGRNIEFNVTKLKEETHSQSSDVVLFVGVGMLISVPIFKTVTHMPPFMGMLLGLSIMWILTTYLHLTKPEEFKNRHNVTHALKKIDTPSVLFFMGILLAVSALQASGILSIAAEKLGQNIQNEYVIGTILGLLSAVIDNVPLVAAAQGMYDLSTYPVDHSFWQFLALTAGTGGSIIIIGSAAGVTVMGLENVNFFWYLKNIAWIALLGFLAGVFTFILQNEITSVLFN